MSLWVILLTLTSAFCVVTSQEHGEGEGVLNTMMMGGDVPSSSVLNAIGMGDGGASGGVRTGTNIGAPNQMFDREREYDAADPQAGPMKKFTLAKVQTMIDGMNNGFRYKYDGTVSTIEDEITISMNQLTAMKAQLQGTELAPRTGTGKKQFSLEEVRMMLDGMINGLQYNYEGQAVTTVTEEVVFTVVELEHMMTDLQTQDQILQQFTLDDLRRMEQGMETAGLQYNYQGQLALEGQPTISLPQLKKYTQQRGAQASRTAPTDIPSKPVMLPGQDLGLTSIAQFTLDQIRNMIAGTERGQLYNYQGEPAAQGEVTLTMEQLQRFMNEILSKGTLPTADFTRVDLERMIQGINNGLRYNYQGQIALPGQAILTRDRVNELMNKLDAKGPMDVGIQTPNFSIGDLRRMILGMDNGLVYNHHGVEARAGEPTLARGYLETLLNQLDPQRGLVLPQQTKSFTLDDINRMMTGMDNGILYNYQGVEAQPGDVALSRQQLNDFLADLRTKGMGQSLQTASFTLDDVNEMLVGMDSGLRYNYQGEIAKPGEVTLTRQQLNGFLKNLRAKGAGRSLQSSSFTLDDVNNMLTGMNRGLNYNYLGVVAQPGEVTLTRQQLNGFLANLRATGVGRSLQTASFTLDDINRMLTGMDIGLRYNYQGVVAKTGEVTLTRQQLTDFKADLQAKGKQLFGTNDVNRMLTGMDGGLNYNYQGVVAKTGEVALTRQQLNGFLSNLRAKGMGRPLQTASFTLDDVNRMLTGMDGGLSYNYQGVLAKPGEVTLTRKQLNDFLADLRAKGMRQSLEIASFTLDDINRMLTGMDRGLNYNYLGIVAQPGELTLTKQQLHGFLAELKTKGMGQSVETASFTLDDINRIMAGMDRGVVASPGDLVLTRKQLNGFLADIRDKANRIGTRQFLQSALFTFDDVKRMLTGMDGGLSYNYQGAVAKPGDVTLTRQQLNGVLENLRAKGMGGQIQTPSFTLDDIFRMLAGMDNGVNYNFQGLEAKTGEPILTRERLNQLMSELGGGTGMGGAPLQTPSFTFDGINRMLTGMDNGLFYNYQGVVASQGEPTLKRGQLNQFLADLRAKGMGGAPLQTPSFTFDEINRMLTGMDNGLFYNYQGVVASQGEPTLKRERLNQFLADLRAKGQGEPTLKREQLNQFLADLRAKGMVGAPLQTPSFTFDDINRMLTGMDNGLFYNYQGVVASQGEPTLKRGQLNQFLADLRAKGMGGAPLQTPSFTFDEINRMLTGMDSGLFYNYQGVVASQGEPTLKRERLNQFLADIRAKGIGGVPLQTPSFTFDDVNRMLTGMDNGLFYNYQGVVASQGEPTLKRGQLSQFLADLRTKGMGSSPLQTPSFTFDDINRMLTGMDNGLFYNYQGVVASQGEPTLKRGQLNKFLADLRAKGMVGAPLQTPSFTFDDINRMLTGMDNGLFYNYQGGVASQGEPTLKRGQLNQFLADLRAKGMGGAPLQTPSFTFDEINRMLTGMDNGLFYNYQGVVASQGEPTLKRERLNQFLADLRAKGIGGVPLQTPSFTFDDVNRMLTGMDNGLFYNNQGVVASQGEPTLKRGQLNQFLADLRAKGMGGAPLETPSFTFDDINRMLTGMDNGLFYNYQGVVASQGEPTLKRGQLNQFLADLRAKGMGGAPLQTPSFTFDEINRMLTGMDNGLFYNYQGVVASQGEPTLKRERLNQFLADLRAKGIGGVPLQTPSFTFDDVNRMLTGMDNGVFYNYQGVVASQGEPTLKRGQLNQFLADLRTKGMGGAPLQTPAFTFDDLNRMLTGMDNGLFYNYQGVVASQGEPTLKRGQLNQFLADLRAKGMVGAPLQTPSFTFDDINRMLTGMDNGLFYNYQGVVASQGEPTLKRGQLNQFLADLRAKGMGGAPLQTPSFTFDEINRMLTGMDNGLFYNYQGVVASQGEPTLKRERLNQFLADLRAKGMGGDPLQTSSFTFDDVNRMLTGMDSGLFYNYQGVVASQGEPTLKRGQLNQFLADLRAKGMGGTPLKTPSFTFDDINRMLTGMDSGLFYNYQGVVASQGEPTLKRGQLNQFLADLRSKGMGGAHLQSPSFTFDDVNRMLTGMDNGVFYNYQGVIASQGEPTLKRERLNKFLADLRAKGMGGAPLKTPLFTFDDVNRMLKGMDNGVFYNYQGVVASQGEQTLKREQLNQFLADLRAKGMGGAPLQTPSFTFDDVNRMLTGMDNGLFYNYQGVVASQGEPTLKRERLNQFLEDLRAKGMGGTHLQLASFTSDDVNRMLTGMDNGLFYNDQGLVASPGEPTLKREQLNQYLGDLRDKGMGGLPLQTPSFSFDDVNRMLTGMDNGLFYNYKGVFASPGEPTLSRQQLNQFLADIRPKDKGGAPLQPGSFALNDVNRMLTGMDNGFFYNYQGVVATQGEPTLKREQLNQYLADLRAKGMGDAPLQPGSFTFDDINRMLTGMDNGLFYNYKGVVASPGEPTLKRGQLNQYLADLRAKGIGSAPLQPTSFAFDDVNRMLTGMDNGLFYNHQGVVASQGEPTLKREQLNQYLIDLRAKGVADRPSQTADFTLTDVERMISGMNQGDKFNYRGLLADPGEPTLSSNQLTELLQQLQVASGIDVQSSVAVERLVASESSSETTMQQFNGTGGTFETSSSSESSSTASAASESFVIVDTPFGEGSNVVDINLVAKGEPGYKVPEVQTETAGFKGETKVSESKDAVQGLGDATVSDVVIHSQSGNEMQIDKTSSQNILKDKQAVDQTVKSENVANSMQQNSVQGSTSITPETKSSLDLDLTGIRNIRIGELANEIGTVNIIIGGGSGPKSDSGTAASSTDISTQISNEIKNITTTNIGNIDVARSKITTDFTTDQINRMLDGINQGLSYNYSGLPAQEGDAILTREMLNKYIADRTTRGPREEFAKFTRDDINRMVDGISRGEFFNYRGLPPTLGEKTLTLDDLNRIRTNLDAQGTGGSPSQTQQFTTTDLERMITGMKNGERFNYEGLPAAVGDPVLSIDRLNELLNQLQKVSGQVLEIPLDRFTRNDINRMIDGINRGENYNVFGLAPSSGDRVLTLDDLNSLRSRLDAQVGVPMLRFAADDINRMIEGIRGGKSYNYQGLPPSPGEKTLTIADLTKLLADLDVKLQLVSVDTERFTLDELRRMLTGMDNGLVYNFHGQIAGPGESTLTRQQLNAFYRTLAGGQHTFVMANVTLDEARFSIDDVKRMMRRMDQGQKYNYQGQIATTGEPTITRDQLNRLLFTLESKRIRTSIKTTFTLNQIRNMLEGIDRGLTYDYQGREAGLGIPAMSRDDLNFLLLDLLASHFNRDDINTMLDRMNRGDAYNYEGKLATGGEPTLTRDQLNRLLFTLEIKRTQPSSKKIFTLNQIRNMLDGMDRGLMYDNQGREAGAGVPALTRDELTVMLLDLLASRLNRDDIDRMLVGMDRGDAYNYEGKLATVGEPALTRDHLNRLLSVSNKTITIRRKFTLPDIQRMLDGMDMGNTYSYQGSRAGPGDVPLTRDDIFNNLFELLASRFNRDDVDRMLIRTDAGDTYNYEGKLATGGERTLTRDNLNRLLNILGSATTVPRWNFTLDEIQTMLQGMNTGISYNTRGREAGLGETPLTRDEIIVYLLDLLASRFNMEDINRMIAGIDKGEAYNFEGNVAKTGEPVLEREYLNRVLPILRRPGSTQRNFTRDQILRMFDGIDRGVSYNYHGNEARQGEPTLSKDELQVTLFNILNRAYTIDDLFKMLDNMEKGTSYTYDGNVAKEGDTTWHRDMLEKLLIYLLGIEYDNVSAMKPAEISSVFNPKWTADKGVDGNRDGNINSDSCFHTLEELNPYFMVDLGRVYNLNSLVIFNREDCCSERAKNLVISTGYSKNDLDVTNTVAGPIGNWYIVRFTPGTNERYVKIQSRHNTSLPLHLCEVEIYGTPANIVYPNVALDKPAEMSSEFNPRWTADKGVDGNTSQNALDNSCFHTGSEVEPYYIIDLQAIYDINRVYLFNREDCCSERTRNIEISTGVTRNKFVPREFISGVLQSVTDIPFNQNVEARFIKVQRKDPEPDYLHLCEVQVFGEYLREAYPNVALNKPAELSSMYEPNSTYTADKGVDGNTAQSLLDNSCFHTGRDVEPYFIVDLQSIYDIKSINLFNRQDCCNDRAKNIEIYTALERSRFVPRELIAGPLPSEELVRFREPIEAQFIKIQIKDLEPTYLHLCEVEVFGEYLREDSCIGIVPPCQNGGYCTNLGGVNNCICTEGWTGPTCSQKTYPNVALNRPAEISSTFNPTYTADKGVDGNPSQIMSEGSCFHTLNETEPYFIVDLGSVYDIDNLYIYNRQDCCDDRAKNIEISTGLTREKVIPREFIAGPLTSETSIPFIRPNEAQFVKIQIKDTEPAYLHLCEVQVRGEFVRDDSCAGVVPPCKNGGYCTNLGGVHNCLCTEGWTGLDCSKRARPNIAFRKNTEMSTVFNDKWTSDKAVDGNKNTNIQGDSCFHTLEEVKPYWRVDLGAVYDVDQIEIYNRADCCSDRLHDVAISTGLTRDDFVVQQYMNGPLQENTAVYFNPDVRAQFIQLQNMNNTPEYLHVCEVIVNGNYVREDLCAVSPCLNGGTCTNEVGQEPCRCPQGWTGSRCHINIDNIAYNKPTELSSLFKNDIKYGGDKGVDGDPNGDMTRGSCFHTEKERQPYWMVNLGAVYDLERVVLHNRQDSGMERARDIEILAGLTKDEVKPVYFHSGELGPMRIIPIPSGTEGQYVMVHIKDLRPEFLHLCEVEIYGTYLREDLCKRNPCRNGGTCTNRQGGAICLCPPGYGGIFCRRDESYVRPTPPTGVTDVPEPDWDGSRIDPATCRRAQCNLPICYVPYASDCAKYVVCQRTAIGTYVAWKMRCAFGSYWGTGRTWTCERVDDLVKQGYVCPNDQCANKSLITYPDEDVTNCRTFWRCVNGISKPACCPPGRAFNRDTLQCESDPHEYCRSPCPLKLDGCIVPGSRTEPFYDGNCRTYWDCQSGHPHPVCCNSGTSYDFVLGYCKEDITCTDSCPSEYTTNICRQITGASTVVSYSLADGNCRTYMKCTEDGFDDPYCCRQDYYYNTTTAQCELLEDDYPLCRHARCPRGYKEECRFTPISGSPTQFFDNDAHMIRDCAPGTTFAPNICVCDGSSLINICKAEVWAKFDKLQDKWSVKNYGDGWISVFGDMSKNRTAQGITYGTFDGSSGMEVWRYDHTALPEVTLEITFQPVASGINRQILVSNCMSVDNGDASFEVSLDPRSARILFKGKSKFDAAELSLPYNRQGWNTFKLFFDGEHLAGVIEDPAGIGKTEIQAANLRGDITAGVGAMKFGPCLDSFSMPKDNGFTGFVSEVIFSKCVDVRGREFIKKHIVPEVRRYPARN